MFKAVFPKRIVLRFVSPFTSHSSGKILEDHSIESMGTPSSSCLKQGNCSTFLEKSFTVTRKKKSHSLLDDSESGSLMNQGITIAQPATALQVQFSLKIHPTLKTPVNLFSRRSPRVGITPQDSSLNGERQSGFTLHFV